MLLTSVRGTTDLELSGHLTQDKLQTTAEDLFDLLIALLPSSR